MLLRQAKTGNSGKNHHIVLAVNKILPNAIISAAMSRKKSSANTIESSLFPGLLRGNFLNTKGSLANKQRLLQRLPIDIETVNGARKQTVPNRH